MEKKNYNNPEMSEIELNTKEDILTGSGYTDYDLYDEGKIADISEVDKVYWGKQ